MPVTEAVIMGVHGRTQTRKSDGKPFTVYEVSLGSDDRKYQTFSKSIATEANRMLNQRAEVEWHSEQRGAFENFYVDDVRMPTGNSQLPPQQPQQPQQQQQYVEPPWEPQAAQNGYQPWQDAREQAIHRQTAAKVSAHISKNPAEFWANLDELVQYFGNGTKPDRFQRFVPPEMRQTTADIPQAPQQNEFVPAGAYDQPSGNYQVDDDIPF